MQVSYLARIHLIKFKMCMVEGDINCISSNILCDLKTQLINSSSPTKCLGLIHFFVGLFLHACALFLKTQSIKVILESRVIILRKFISNAKEDVYRRYK